MLRLVESLEEPPASPLEERAELLATLDEIENFITLRSGEDAAETEVGRMQAHLLARRIGDAFAGNFSSAGLAAAQRACILSDLLTPSATRERVTDWSSLCLQQLQELRVILADPRGDLNEVALNCRHSRKAS